MKKHITTIILACICMASATASEITPTSTPIKYKGQVIGATLQSPVQLNAPYYRMVWRVVTVSGHEINVPIMPLFYGTQGTTTQENMYCATTYQEMKTKADSLNIAIPAQESGQP